MQLQFPKVKASRALKKKEKPKTHQEQWLTAPNIIVMQVPMVLAPIRARYSKGKHMPGHMGNVQVTVQNLEIVRVDTENNLLLVKGAVPGPKKSLVTIKETVKSL